MSTGGSAGSGLSTLPRAGLPRPVITVANDSPESEEEDNTDNRNRHHPARLGLLDHHPRPGVALHDQALLFGDDANLLRKAVASTRNGGDVTVLRGRGTQSLAQHEDVLRQVGFLDESIGPDRLHQVVFQNHLFAVAHQHQQGFESLQL